MADSVTLPGTGAVIATDSRTIAGAAEEVQRVDEIGATVIVSGQAAPTTTAATLVNARETRKRITFVNQGTVNVFIGPATVTVTTGFLLLPGAGMTCYSTALFQAIAANGQGSIHYIEEYDS